MKTQRPIVYRHGHELANKDGKVRLSRVVLYEKLKGVAGNCNWCNTPLVWKTVCADHLDGDTTNNAPNNLVSSCRGCNANREDGTGHGRKQPTECKICKKLFTYGTNKNQKYCSNKCASFTRKGKKGSIAKHGTRSRYNYGCRCPLCHAENLRMSRIYYQKNK